MGWCHEFGPQIKEGCGHPMRAGEASCSCPECGVECTGKFDGCADVWLRRAEPVEVELRAVEGPRMVVPLQRPRTAQGIEFGRAPRRADLGPSAGPLAGPLAGPATAAADLPATLTDGAEVVEWLRGAFEGLWSELQTLGRTIAEHDSLLTKLTGEDGENGEGGENRIQSLHALAQSLSERVESVVSSALTQRDEQHARTVDGVVDDIRDSLDTVERSAAELISALEESFGEDFDDVASEIRQAVDEAGREAEKLRSD